MQLTDETVVAASLIAVEVLRRFVFNVRGRAGWRRNYETVTVRSFDGCAVKSKDDQQQAERTRVSMIQ